MFARSLFFSHLGSVHQMLPGSHAPTAAQASDGRSPNDLSSAEAREAARKEGLELVTSTNNTGFKGVIRAPGYKRTPARPFVAVVHVPVRTTLGRFETAEHAALACARYYKTFSGVPLRPGVAGGSKRRQSWGRPTEAAAAGGPGEVESNAAKAGEGSLNAASLLGDPWWKRQSEERASIDALSEESVEARAKADRLELITSTRNQTGYAGVFKRKRRRGGADRYEALWAPGQLELAKMGLRTSVSFGTWERPDQAALVLAQEIRRIRDATGRNGSREPERDAASATTLGGVVAPVPAAPSEGGPTSHAAGEIGRE